MVVAASGLLLWFVLCQSEVRELPKVEKLSGGPTIWRPVTFLQPLSGETTVAKDDRLGAGRASDAHVLVDGEFRVILMKGLEPREDQGVAIERGTGQLLLRVVRKGTLAVESAGKKFEIDLGKELGSVKGEDAFVVVRHPGGGGQGTFIVVFHGSVTVSHPLGPVKLDQGEKALLTPKNKPGRTVAAAQDYAWPRDENTPENLLDQPRPATERQTRCTWSYKERDGMKCSFTTAQWCRPGVRSLWLELDTKSTNESFPPQVDVELEPGVRYMLQVFVRTEKYMVDGKPGQLGLTVLPVAKTADGKEEENSVKRVTSDDTLSCEGRWQPLRLYFPAPGSLCRIRIYKGQGGDFAFKGSIYMADWLLKKDWGR